MIIGGSAAGPKAAAKARRMDEHAEVVILQKDADLSMASCGYPYYVGGYFDDRNMLLCTPAGIVRDPQFYLNAKNIKAGTNTEVTGIDRKAHEVSFKSLLTGVTGTVAYDKLVIATGATPRMPPIPGVDLKGITTLQSMKDADFLRRVRDEGTIKKAVIIGGGLIGIETCEALQLAGVEITVIELLPQLLTFLDWDLAKLVENHVKTKNANVITGNGIVEFLGENGRLTGVKLANGTELPCELAVVAIGVIPNVKLAREAGLSIRATGGIEVNEYMQTSDPDIYAVGDCVGPCRITGKRCWPRTETQTSGQGGWRERGDGQHGHLPRHDRVASARSLTILPVHRTIRDLGEKERLRRYRHRHEREHGQTEFHGRRAHHRRWCANAPPGRSSAPSASAPATRPTDRPVWPSRRACMWRTS